MIAYLFFFHMVHMVHIGSGMAAQQSFCKACQNYLRQSLQNAVRMHELLLCCESSRKCHDAVPATPTWTKTIFEMFYKIEYCAAKHGRI